MKEFSKYVADTWNISEPCARELCDSFEKGHSPYYCADYRSIVCSELDVWGVWRIYDFLRFAQGLLPKKKRLVNALKKSGKLTQDLETRITHLTNESELDDMLLPERLNPRSKGQLAVKKGLGALADAILSPETPLESLEASVAPFIGTDPSLKTADDVISSVKDIIAERFAYDETARTMVREFMYDDGLLEVTPKSKTGEFAKYAGKLIGVRDITREELLMLLTAEDKKLIRLKLTVQLFRITELLKHHFVVNPDSAGYQLIAEAIDDSWLRLLQPIAERDVKVRLRGEAEETVLQSVMQALVKQLSQEGEEKLYCACGVIEKKHFALVVCSDRGRLSGAALEKKIAVDKPGASERLKQFAMRYRPSSVFILDNESAAIAETIVKKSFESQQMSPEIVMVPQHQADLPDIAHSPWMQKEFSDLEEPMQRVFAAAIARLRPGRLIPKIGVEYFSLHPFQQFIAPEKMTELVQRIIAERLLSGGISAVELGEVLPSVNLEPFVGEPLKKEIAGYCAKTPLASKDDLLKVPGMTESVFRNLAGYCLVPTAEFALDRTLVHPDHFSWVMEMCDNLRIAPESLISDPEAVRSFPEPDAVMKLYLEKKLIGQLIAGQRFSGSAAFFRPKKKYKLMELEEGAVVSGRVTNITPFGVFVNINAVCDGLIHISQLTDTYVESAEQVVSVNDIVNVRILKVDAKKRRISLSMKGLGHQGPKVSPSKRQLTDLASHFQNR
jgi:protein Tex